MVDSETLEQQVLHVKDAKVVGGPIYVGKAYEHRPPGEKERPRAVLVDMRAEPEGRGEEFLDTGNVGQVLRWPSDVARKWWLQALNSTSRLRRVVGRGGCRMRGPTVG